MAPMTDSARNRDQLRSEAQENKDAQKSDRALWLVWMGLMMLAVILLPFIVRQSALVQALADMCMTALGLAQSPG